jgi:hypothetical protein
MKKRSRSRVVSSFTIVKGAMIDETYAVFRKWDLSRSKRENLDILRDTNFIGAQSATWLRDVTKVLNRRFEPDGRDKPLVLLAQQESPMEEWKPLLLWHMTRDEFLLSDFIQHWLFKAYTKGQFRVRPEELHSYLKSIKRRGGKIEHEWSEATLHRVAAGLLKIAADFDLLKGSATKEFTSYHLPERSFIYMLHAIRERELNPGRLLSAADWRLFLMSPEDVERELLRLHQYRKLHYEVAGSLMQLTLPCKSVQAYAERMAA